MPRHAGTRGRSAPSRCYRDRDLVPESRTRSVPERSPGEQEDHARAGTAPIGSAARRPAAGRAGHAAAGGHRPHPAGEDGRADRRRRRPRGARASAPAASSSTPSSRRSGCRSWRRWTARSSSPPTARRIARANVHLVPDPDIPTSETGTRHRTAERVARQIDVPVITVSEEMSRRRDPPPRQEAHARADPARARPRRPGAADPRPLQDPPRRGERRAVGARGRRPRDRARRRRPCCSGPRWCAASRTRSRSYVIELGADGRLVLLQLEELMGGVEDDRRLVRQGLLRRRRPTGARTTSSSALADLDTDDAARPARGRRRAAPPARRRPRHLGPAARLPPAAQDPAAARDRRRPRRRAVLQPAEDHAGEHRRPRRGRRRRRGAARAIKDGLSRLAETSILERYV